MGINFGVRVPLARPMRPADVAKAAVVITVPKWNSSRIKRRQRDGDGSSSKRIGAGI